MSVRRRAMAALVATTALLAGALGAAAPAQAATGSTYAQFVGTGDYILGTGTYSYTPAGSTITADLTSSAVSISISDGTGSWNLILRAPAGDDLVEGQTYTDAQRAPFAEAPHPGLELSGHGRGCNVLTGRFTILELVKDAGTGDVTGVAATFEQYCEGQQPPARGTVGFNASKSPATITSTTKATAVIGAPVTVSGTLTDAAGPLAGAPVTVSRPDGSGGTTTFDATTGADGAFAVQDTMGSANRIYTVDYAGDDAHYAASIDVSVAAVKASSTLVLSAPTTVKRGTAYSVKGTLTSGGLPVKYASVTLVRKDLAGSRTIKLTTTSAGTFAKSDTPAVGGTVSWTVSWAGTASQASAKSTRSVTVPRARTSLSVTTDKTMYAYGTTAKVRVHLGTTYNGRIVSVYAKKYGASTPALIGRGKVSSTGYLTVSYRMTTKTSFSAKFAGDYRYQAATGYATRYARAKVGVAMYGWSGRSGSTYTYRAGATATGVVTVYPNRSGGCVAATIQRKSGSSWITGQRFSCLPLDGFSQNGFYITTNGATGYLRLQFTVATSTANAGASSGWIYLHYV
ncbi:MAG: hypothetical protein AB7I24_08525 [Candidatus Nanopelagicales bacterium]